MEISTENTGQSPHSMHIFKYFLQGMRHDTLLLLPFHLEENRHLHCRSLHLIGIILRNVKVIVHPKMKILSFTPPSSCFKPVCFFLLLSTKEDILKNVGSQTVGRMEKDI